MVVGIHVKLKVGESRIRDHGGGGSNHGGRLTGRNKEPAADRGRTELLEGRECAAACASDEGRRPDLVADRRIGAAARRIGEPGRRFGAAKRRIWGAARRCVEETTKTGEEGASLRQGDA